ncbi:hypothetical protein JRI60_03085 [Archangium violaceum]|uniref:hypothetical protein n=1 Tax=Archangium violaceum TaxID=83451 RepID=UPI00194EB543|nr:hypothetical protein [Archangium violaceum]QRN98074.1 hypothetical protein JRI60_03085 [Archangium violaceum]
MTTQRRILLEGYTPEDILRLSDEELRAFVFTDEPLVFQAGSANILGRFQVKEARLVVELAQIDGGGEGILRTLWRLAERHARDRGLDSVEWIVHAVHCAQPNLKLRRVLDGFGFVVREVPGHGVAYHYVHDLQGVKRSR